MQPEYETVVDAGSMMVVGIPLLVHGMVVASQFFVAGFWLVHGVIRMLRPDFHSPTLDKLGALSPPAPRPRVFGAIEVGMGIAVLLPVVAGWPVAVSAVGCFAAIGMMMGLRDGVPERGARVRRAVAVAAALTLAFMAWEGDDPATQTMRIATKSMEWRVHEVGWQRVNDQRSPKVGDLAPDFELYDPEGVHSVQLATFRGKRPVALVFGSYT